MAELFLKTALKLETINLFPPLHPLPPLYSLFYPLILFFMSERPIPPEVYQAAMGDNPENPELDNERLEKLMEEERREHDKRLDEVVDGFVMRREDEEARKLNEVVGGLTTRREAGKKGASKIRTLILALSGAATGTYEAGQLAALLETGITPKEIDNCVGISTGAGGLLYYVTSRENYYKGVGIYTHVLNEKGFLNWKNWPRIMNLGVVFRAVLKGERAVNIPAVMASSSGFWVIAQNTLNEKNEIINAKNDPINAVHATMAVPYFYGEKVQVEGGTYTDGAFAETPLEDIIKKFEPTHVLIIPNMPFEDLANFKIVNGVLKVIEWFLPEEGTPGVFKKVLQREGDVKSLRQACDEISVRYGVKIGWLWPPDCGIRPTTTDSALLQNALQAAAVDAYKKFNKYNPDPTKREKQDFPFWC